MTVKLKIEYRGKNVHIFTKISNYALEFMEFLSSNFSIENHLFCFREITPEQVKENKFSKYIISIQDGNFFYFEFPAILKESKRIILHSFPISYSLFFWLIHKRYLKKSVWSVWGFDLYWYSLCKKSFRNRLFEKIRRKVIPEVKTILCPIYEDFLYVKEIYKVKAEYHQAMYPIPTNFSYLNSLYKEKNTEAVNIQIGNSATRSNNLIELLDILKPLKNDAIKITCFLSYGEKDYSDEVLKRGKDIFEKKFNPITDFLSKEKFAEAIASIDILIMNNVRQQGLGNIFSYLYLGKKVYIRSDNSMYHFFTRKGIEIYDTLDLRNDPGSLKKMNLERLQENREKTMRLLDLKTYINEWKPILV